MITNLPGATPMKPGSATKPFFGIQPIILNEDQTETPVRAQGGRLCIKYPWPGMLRGTWGDPENKRVKEVYFSTFPGKYFTGDGCRKDEDGYYWLHGPRRRRHQRLRSPHGHRRGRVRARVSHPLVAEAAVVGFPHDIKGEGIYAYVILKAGAEAQRRHRRKILRGHVRNEIGPIATPDHIHFVPELPKTRSGKIMRRILRKVAAGERDLETFGDISTLADPSVVQTIVDGAPDVK